MIFGDQSVILTTSRSCPKFFPSVFCGVGNVALLKEIAFDGVSDMAPAAAESL